MDLVPEEEAPIVEETLATIDVSMFDAGSDLSDLSDVDDEREVAEPAVPDEHPDPPAPAVAVEPPTPSPMPTPEVEIEEPERLVIGEELPAGTLGNWSRFYADSQTCSRSCLTFSLGQDS